MHRHPFSPSTMVKGCTMLDFAVTLVLCLSDRSRRILSPTDGDMGSGLPVIDHPEVFKFMEVAISTVRQLDECLSQIRSRPTPQRVLVVFDRMTRVDRSGDEAESLVARLVRPSRIAFERPGHLIGFIALVEGTACRIHD